MTGLLFLGTLGPCVSYIMIGFAFELVGYRPQFSDDVAKILVATPVLIAAALVIYSGFRIARRDDN